jgi:hypothetical protein
MHQDIRIGAPAAPGNNEVVNLVDTTGLFGKSGLRMNSIHRITLSFPGLDQASAAAGLIGYTSPDHGANWYKDTFAPAGDPSALPATVAAQTASATASFDIDVTPFDDVKITFTAGATGPTVWTPVIVLEIKRVSGV